MGDALYPGHQKVQIDLKEAQEIIRSAGGLDSLTVFGCYTYHEGSIKASGEIAKERDVYTEWGHRGADIPLIAHHIQGENHTYHRFEEVGQ